MWSYYGSKSKIIKHYPAPIYDKIIEPFAGTAQYALRYFEKDILLVDKYEVIVRVWKWLQQCSPKDLLTLPRLKCGETTDSYSFDCIEAKWFVGLIITGGSASPKKTASKWKTTIRPNSQDNKINFAANNLHRIRHWKIELGDYRDIENQKATWFIDPPYQNGGQYYVHGNKTLDFCDLANWSRGREGQVLVCENSKADWMPFSPLVSLQGSKYQTKEVLWTNIDILAQLGE